MKEVVHLHWIPASIVSDRDSIFMSVFWKELFKLQGTQLNMHPKSDDQTEVLNRTVETYLRCFCWEQPKNWMHYVSWTKYWYNTSYHGAVKCTPFEVVYGRPPPPITRYVPGESTVEGWLRT